MDEDVLLKYYRNAYKKIWLYTYEYQHKIFKTHFQKKKKTFTSSIFI